MMKTQMNGKTGKAAAQRKYGKKQTCQLTDNRAQTIQRKGLVSAIQNGNRVFQFAGDYGGLLPKHETYAAAIPNGATYHHIIPENRLKLVVPKLKRILQPAGARPSEVLGTFKGQAEQQWLRTRITDTVFAINGMYDEIQVTDGEIAPILKSHADLGTLFPAVYELLFAKLKLIYSSLNRRISHALATVTGSYTRDELGGVAAGVIQAAQCENQLSVEFLRDLFLMSAEKELVHKEKSRFRINKAVVCTEIARLPNRLIVAEMYPALGNERPGSLKGILRANAVPGVEDKWEAAVCWIPGNIHRGPSKRVVDTDGIFNELLDDGGEKFEKSAANLVSPLHYRLLVNLNSDMEQLIALPVGDAQETELAEDVIRQMTALQRIGLTQYNAAKWGPADPANPANTKRRIVRDDQKLEQAGLVPVDAFTTWKQPIPEADD